MNEITQGFIHHLAFVSVGTDTKAVVPTLSSAQTAWNALPIVVTVTFDRPVAQLTGDDLQVQYLSPNGTAGQSLPVLDFQLTGGSVSQVSSATFELQPQDEGKLLVVLPSNTVVDSLTQTHGNIREELTLTYGKQASKQHGKGGRDHPTSWMEGE